MIFFHKPYYNLNYTNPNKKKYKKYKLYNAKKKKFRNQILKLLNYKHLLTKENLNLKKKSNKFYKKPKEKICLLLLCDLSKLIFFHLF
jgi:hypothetical protein